MSTLYAALVERWPRLAPALTPARAGPPIRNAALLALGGTITITGPSGLLPRIWRRLLGPV